MGKMSRQKGKRGEREVAARLKSIFGNDIRRGYQARSGKDEPDVTGEAMPKWLHVEVKYRNVIPPLGLTYIEACSDSAPSTQVIAIYWRKTRERTWRVTTAFSSLAWLLGGPEPERDPVRPNHGLLVTLDAEDFEKLLALKLEPCRLEATVG
jgi:hypothetical protein